MKSVCYLSLLVALVLPCRGVDADQPGNSSQATKEKAASDSSGATDNGKSAALPLSDFSLVGILAVGRSQRAAIIDNRRPEKRRYGLWFGLNEQVGEFVVEAIDGSSVALRNRVSGELTNLHLPSSKTGDADVIKPKRKIIDPANLDWTWIRSAANPMRSAPESLPEWVIRAWDELDEDIKTDFKNFYRTHGWELTRVELRPDGRIRQSVSPLPNPAEPVLSDQEKRAQPNPVGVGVIKK